MPSSRFSSHPTSFSYLFAAMVLVFSTSCQKNSNSTDASTDETIEASFENLNTTVFQVKCIGCHSSTADQGIDFTNYDSLMNSVNSQGGFAVIVGEPSSSRIWIRTRSSGGMPPVDGALTSAENEAIRQWIAAGAEP